MIAIAFGVVPRVIRNAMYDGVARIRYRIFGRTKDACPMVPPDLRSRFTGDACVRLSGSVSRYHGERRREPPLSRGDAGPAMKTASG